MRIASLLPSATEIVAAVGARDELVGISHECDFPAGVAGLPVLTRPRVAFPRASGAIDRAVRQVLEDALAVYEIELDRLREVAPDVIVTQALCDVCAVSLDDVRAALRELACENVEVVSLEPGRLSDVWGDVRRVGAATGHAEEGERAAAELERRCDLLRARTAAFDARPSVLTVEWIEPVMIGGTWMPELVEIAGGTALVTVPGQHAPTLALEDLRALDPDVVLVKPCGFDLARTAEEAALLQKVLPWSEWRAAREGRVFVADGNAYFNRPGPRLVESAEILAACMHPSACEDLVTKHAAAMRRVRPDGVWVAAAD
ncbi:corrinoid ABC transporter substrate-binding protein [Planctomycetes bacterium Pla163]|uniref:Corrinoid ABC transporter substrate-binding protein n=1 Tax=Rohdeia mirabilis TaxID=2528008 RepID=A0A518CUL2_9BACT|nr:corrinoid ABC transporter substrate-binding protein [Planctomycetes bacterium Pla163]